MRVIHRVSKRVRILNCEISAALYQENGIPTETWTYLHHNGSPIFLQNMQNNQPIDVTKLLKIKVRNIDFGSYNINDLSVNEYLIIIKLYPVIDNRGPEGISQNDKWMWWAFDGSLLGNSSIGCLISNLIDDHYNCHSCQASTVFVILDFLSQNRSATLA